MVPPWSERTLCVGCVPSSWYAKSPRTGDGCKVSGYADVLVDRPFRGQLRRLDPHALLLFRRPPSAQLTELRQHLQLKRTSPRDHVGQCSAVLARKQRREKIYPRIPQPNPRSFFFAQTLCRPMLRCRWISRPRLEQARRCQIGLVCLIQLLIVRGQRRLCLCLVPAPDPMLVVALKRIQLRIQLVQLLISVDRRSMRHRRIVGER